MQDGGEVLEFAREDSSVWNEASDLIHANHAETGALPAEDFAPNRDRYEAAEKMGVLRVHTARLAGKLVGYSVFLVGPHPDYPNVIFATNTVLFVAPEHRGRGAFRFMLWQDEKHRDAGIDVVFRSVTVKHNYRRALEAMGYREEETKYFRDFRREPSNLSLGQVAADLNLPCPLCGHKEAA